MDKLIKPSRMAILVLILIALSGVTLMSLYRLQIIDGAAYAEQAKDSIVSTTVIKAARGNILDRYGRVLVTNRTCNNIIINHNELFEQEDPNSIILELVQYIADAGERYTDELPITKTAPFEYIRSMTDIQRSWLNSFLEREGLNSATTAVELMAYFRDRYKIDSSYTSEQTRTIAGIRYEINNRYQLGVEYIFAEDISIDLITRLMENTVPGFQVVSSFVREYNTDAAAHLLGYITMINPIEADEYEDAGYPANALVGRDGIEKAFESWLHGTDGEATVVSTKGGTTISTEYTKEVEPGGNVTVTIDIGLQEVAESTLKNYIEKTNAQREADNEYYESLPGYESKITSLITGGGIAVIDVKTGEPLALASYPDYDVSRIMEDFDELRVAENDPMFNRALQGRYAPGSTFKPVTAIAALGERAISTGTTITDEGKYTDTGDESYQPTCWIYSKGATHGTINVTEAIKVSCNYFFYEVGKRLGIDKLSEYAMRFGLGVSTGIELYEDTGHMSTQESAQFYEDRPWYIGDTLQAAIGQSYSVFSPLQLAVYTAALANDGLRYDASILKGVRSYDNSESLYERVPVVADDIDVDQSYYDAVLKGMYDVANAIDGTAYSTFGNYEYTVAAKTGSAQVGTTIADGVFICYAPYDDPQIAIAIAIEKGGAGSTIATVAKNILEYYFNFKNSTTTLETENSLLK